MKEEFTRRAFAVEPAQDDVERTLGQFEIREEILKEAMAAASAVLKANNVPALLHNIEVARTSEQRAGACRCAEYETVYLPVTICDSEGCRVEYRVSQNCVRWECD